MISDHTSQKNVRFEPKTPIELHYLRRMSVGHQKRQLILAQLSNFPDLYLICQCVILTVLTLILFGTQIAIIVNKTQLFYICSGFWVGLIYMACVFSLIYLSKINFH